MIGDPKDWITVASVPGLGALSVKRLWEAGWTPNKLLSADSSEWQRLGLKIQSITALSSLQKGQASKIQRKVDDVLEWLEQNSDISALPITAPEYPELLQQIADPPPVLFCQGNLGALNVPQLAMVGSRNPTTPGLRNAHSFAAYLAQNGLIINSGLALGIDAAAHQGCVDHGCSTVAVLGTGLKTLYPARNKRLAKQILDNDGVLVTEFFPETPPRAANFPKRNRIISGMSAGVLVVEAALKSGSLITARMALEQNREVFALPGSLNNPLSKGCHKLIREGAYLVESAADIIAEIGPILGVLDDQSMPSGGLSEKPLREDLSASEEVILRTMGYDVQTVDQIILNTGLAMNEVAQLLVALELKGLVAPSVGGYIRL